jgi:hypothetical protein
MKRRNLVKDDYKMSELAQLGDILLADEAWINGQQDTLGKISVGYHPNDTQLFYPNIDPDRVGRRYLVIDATLTGGGVAHGHDVYSDGHRITAQQLPDDGTFDLSKGEIVQFYQTGEFRCKIPHVTVVGRMRLSHHWEKV